MKRLRNRHLNQPADEDNPYWISFSDIMSGLLVIFVLASLALILELMQTRQDVSAALLELQKAEQARREIVEEIVSELKQRDIVVEISENHTVIRVGEEQLAFESDQYRLPADTRIRSNVLTIGQVMHHAIQKDQRWQYLDTVFIEGHTDIRPSRRRMGNWGLSTYRAISVWNYWNERLPEAEKPDRLQNHAGRPLFSVSGYGETRPVTVQQRTADEYRKNRRIDIRFTIRRPALEQFDNIQRMISDGTNS